MSKQEKILTYKIRMKQLQESDDTEAAHSEADRLLCELLDSIGYKEVTEEFRKIYKWYA